MNNNTNIFLQQTSNYTKSITKKQALNYLNIIKKTQHNSSNTYDIIDYKKLIYIYVSFYNDEEIQNIINDIFAEIAFIYDIKEKIYKNM